MDGFETPVLFKDFALVGLTAGANMLDEEPARPVRSIIEINKLKMQYIVKMHYKLTPRGDPRTESESATYHWSGHGVNSIYFKNSRLQTLKLDRMMEAFNGFNILSFSFLIVACVSGIYKTALVYHQK